MILIVLGVLIVLLLAAWTVVGYLPTKDIETPTYRVLETKKGYEIREYEPYIVAEVTLDGSYRQSLYGGFGKVADYIFGNNTKGGAIDMTAPVLQSEKPSSEKIAMTSPVLHEESDAGGGYTIAFVMPSEYTMATLPKPNNPEVKLREVPAKRFAVLRFGGYATSGRTARKTKALVSNLARDGVKTTGKPVVAQYNPPWTPPYMRRNEIMLEIASP